MVVIAVLALALRVVYVLLVPDLDVDAYGHFHIGRAVLESPGDLKAHWVWLPGWHFALAGMQGIGATFRDVRLVNAVLATAAPFLLYIHAREGGRSRGAAWLAAASLTVCSLPTIAGTSALMETPFLLLVLGAAVCIDRSEERRTAAFAAGALLTIACAVRYEAWVVVAALGLEALVLALRQRNLDRARALVFALPATCLVAYVVFRRAYDGEWLWFIRETYRFTHMQRGLTAHGAAFELAWFPLIVPFAALGPALLLVPAGLLLRGRETRPARRSAVVPVSLALFLFATYLGKGALGHARYLTVLTPFACLLVARAVELIVERRPTVQRALVAATLSSLVGATALAARSTATSALADAQTLRDKERWAEGKP